MADFLCLCRGQYSDAVLNELESQNDQQVEGILGKVKVLKEVSHLYLLGTSKPQVPRGGRRGVVQALRKEGRKRITKG